MGMKLNKIIPPAVTLTIFAISALLLVRSIAFMSKQINDIFVIDEMKVEANTIKLDLETYRTAAERLNIRTEVKPSAEPQI